MSFGESVVRFLKNIGSECVNRLPYAIDYQILHDALTVSILNVLFVEYPNITPSETGIREGFYGELPGLELKSNLPNIFPFLSRDTKRCLCQ
jgi:hypothetical protein